MSREKYEFDVTHQMSDNFSIRISPANRGSLDQFKNTFSKLIKDNLQRATELLQQQYHDDAIKKVDVKAVQLQINPIKIDKIPAYELVVENVLIINDAPMVNHSRSIISVYKDRLYQVTTSFRQLREKKVKPVTNEFLASLHFDGVLAKTVKRKEM